MARRRPRPRRRRRRRRGAPTRPTPRDARGRARARLAELEAEAAALAEPLAAAARAPTRRAPPRPRRRARRRGRRARARQSAVAAARGAAVDDENSRNGVTASYVERVEFATEMQCAGAPPPRYEARAPLPALPLPRGAAATTRRRGRARRRAASRPLAIGESVVLTGLAKARARVQRALGRRRPPAQRRGAPRRARRRLEEGDRRAARERARAASDFCLSVWADALQSARARAAATDEALARARARARAARAGTAAADAAAAAGARATAAANAVVLVTVHFRRELRRPPVKLTSSLRFADVAAADAAGAARARARRGARVARRARPETGREVYVHDATGETRAEPPRRSSATTRSELRARESARALAGRPLGRLQPRVPRLARARRDARRVRRGESRRVARRRLHDDPEKDPTAAAGDAKTRSKMMHRSRSRWPLQSGPRGRAALCLARRSALAIPGARIIRSRKERGALIPSPSAFRAQLSKLDGADAVVEQTATERARSVEARVRAETTSELAAVRRELSARARRSVAARVELRSARFARRLSVAPPPPASGAESPREAEREAAIASAVVELLSRQLEQASAAFRQNCADKRTCAESARGIGERDLARRRRDRDVGRRVGGARAARTAMERLGR